ncbi:hypothetical protein BCR36DRAFT_34146 [Piromyces finnis]|uniref:P-loop containing nucleoside triphosphate hydrolase protein n=1 Tax=Piromyces finnis TaxID=1754191 RepID=A0A1Y1VCR7_9FUNG|nr:hypothetical protein BCR36DRAFT_34146 [Piromyces finnis]|eukprot:ORX52125.1 hypothetical protein BCR36DRAFT_34146 [Piromyces finnis]
MFKFTDESLKDFMKSSYFSIKYICMRENDKITKRKLKNTTESLNKKMKLNGEEEEDSSDNNVENSSKGKSNKSKYIRIVGDDEIEETILSDKVKYRKINDISFNSENNIINIGHSDDEPDIYIDNAFNCLKDHQIEGIRFLWNNIIGYKRGCIFAHAMGLGKTLQIISFLVTLKQTHLKKAIKIPKILSAGRIMIIVPASLLKNWEEEFIKWMPEDNPDILGHIYTIQDVLKRLNTLKKWYDEGGILLISYSNYRYCLSIKNDNNLSQLYKFYFQNPGPSIIIADEGHNIKNRESAISIMLKKSKTPYRIALTGTPLQNNLEEYWCMIDFVIPGIIGDINYFRSNYSHPIENGMHRDSSKLDRTLASSTMKVLTEYLKPFVLRKDESVLFRYLPPKTEFVFSITLSDFQYDLYTSYLKIHVFGNGEVLIHQARIISILNHPIIFKRLIVNHIKELRNIRSKIYKDNNKLLPLPENKYFADEDNEVKEINDEESKTDIENSTNEDCIINTEETIETDEELIQSSNFHWVNSIFTKYEDVDNIKYSQKMKILKKIIEFCKENQSKVLIFTEYVFTFDYIHQNILKNMNIKYKILDSKVPSSKRQEIINEFNDNNEYTVFLATIRVSGLGYNLITANRVVLLDMGWNPTLDNQAISRTYRYGQKKPVFVYRFHGFQTLEESLFKTNIKKVILSKRTIDIKKAENYFDKQELKHYFTIPEKNPERMIGIPLPSKDPLLNLLIETFNKEIVNATLYHSKFDEDTFEDADPIQVNQLKMKQKLQEKNNRNSIEAVDQNLNNDINVVTESSSNNIDVDNNMNIEYQQQQQQQNIVDITKDSEEKVDQLVNRSILINEEISQTQETIQDLTISKPEINHLVQDKLPQIQKQPSLSIQDSLQQQNTQETDTQNKINTVINQNIIQQSAPTEQEILHQKSGLIQTTNQLSSQTTTPIVQYKSVIQSIPSKKPSSQHKNLIQNNESLSNDKQLQESISLKSHVSKDIQNKEQIVKPKQYQNPILIKMPKQYQYSFPVEDPKPIQEPTSIQLPTSNKNQNLTNELELNNKGPLLSNKPTNKLQNRDINKPNTISNKLQKQDSAFTKSNIQKRKFSDDTQKKIINLSSTQNHVNDKNINSSKENDQSSILSHSSNIRSENRKKRKHSHKHKSKKDHKSSKNLQGDNAILDKDTFLKSSNKIDEKNMNAMNKKQNEHKKINNQAQNNIIDKHSKSKRKEDSFTNYKDIMIIDSDNESSIPYEKTLISHKRKDSIDSIDFPAASEELKRQTSISSNKETPQFNKNKLPPISLTSEDDSTPNVSPNKYKNYQNKNSFKMNKSPSGKLSSVSNSSKSTNKNSYSSNKIDFNFMNSGSPKAKSSTPSLAKTTPTKHKQSQAHKSKSNTPKRIRNTIIIDDKEPSHFNSINHDEVTIPQPKSNENNRSFSSTSSKSVFSSVIDLDINKPSTKKKLSRSNSLNFPSSSIPSQIITGNDNKSSKTSTTSSSSFIERLKKLNKMN